ncbi:MAG: hypothetical protein FJ222_06540 [Lentisphaerae bacterium]|nr:hypothetical protein [Lentisphaerota bacterium]
MKHTDRYLAYVGVLCGLGALALAIHERGPAAATADAEASPLRSAVEALAPTHGPVPSTVVASRLRQDLRLEETQAATLEQVMETCDADLRSAQQQSDALWRSRLDQRARRDAYDALTAILTREQQTDFKAWLQVPAHTNMAGWFACPTDCGCGGS